MKQKSPPQQNKIYIPVQKYTIYNQRRETISIKMGKQQKLKYIQTAVNTY